LFNADLTALGVDSGKEWMSEKDGRRPWITEDDNYYFWKLESGADLPRGRLQL
jgi:hypothetical protein